MLATGPPPVKQNGRAAGGWPQERGKNEEKESGVERAALHMWSAARSTPLLSSSFSPSPGERRGHGLLALAGGDHHLAADHAHPDVPARRRLEGGEELR